MIRCPSNPRPNEQLQRVALTIQKALDEGADWCSIDEELSIVTKNTLRQKGFTYLTDRTIINFLPDAHLREKAQPKETYQPSYTLSVGNHNIQLSQEESAELKPWQRYK